MISPIPYNRREMETMRANVFEFVCSSSEEEYEAFSRSMWRWDAWYHSMEVE